MCIAAESARKTWAEDGKGSPEMGRQSDSEEGGREGGEVKGHQNEA